jgi:hypothetical protein
MARVVNGVVQRRFRQSGVALVIGLLVVLQGQVRHRLMADASGETGPMRLGFEALWRRWPTDYHNLMADSLWLRVIQHVGGQLGVVDSVNVGGVRQAIDLAMDLDPGFQSPALHGVWMLADGKDAEGAIAVCEHARKLHPRDWNYPYLQAFIEFLYRKRHLVAAQLFVEAAELPGAPPGVRRLAAGVYQRGHHRDLAIRTWLAIHASNAGTTRAIAARNLRALGVRVPD